jgi:hypothetical protein
MLEKVLIVHHKNCSELFGKAWYCLKTFNNREKYFLKKAQQFNMLDFYSCSILFIDMASRD